LVLEILGYLKQLEDGKFLDSSGQSRGKVYFLPNTHFENPDEFSPLAPDIRNRTPDISNRTPDISSHLSQFSAEKLEQLYKMAEPVSKHQRVDTAVTKRVIIGLCSIETLSLPILAELLNRSEDSLRKNFLNPMVEKEHTLERAYPQTPNHPKQAYKAV
jgi:ATP-dependent DNA helicase RecG